MISMVILAAGKSTRMPGRNKLLADVEGVPMIRRVAQSALGSKVDEVIVVVGWDEERIRSVIAGLECKITVNRNFEQGQSSSVRRGLEEVNPSSRAVLILPGDVAKIDASSIDRVIEKYYHGGYSIVIAGYEGRSGHPILLDKQLFPEIARIDEETFGLKAIVKKHQNEVCLVETGSRDVLRDVDTATDLAELSQ